MGSLELAHPEEAAFDRFAADYRESVESSIRFSGRGLDFFTVAKAAHLLRVAATLTRPRSEIRALDVGCGTGNLDRLLSPSLGRVVGVDVSSAMVDEAKRLDPEGEYLSYDGARLPFDDGAFDLVFAVCVLHHVDPPLRRAFLDEMWRVTSPGGAAVLVEHNPWNPLTRLSVNRCPFDEGVVLSTCSRTKSLMREVGIPCSWARYILFTPFTGRWTTTFERSALGRIPFGAQYVVEAFKPAEEHVS